MLEYLLKRRRVSGLRINPHKGRSTQQPIAEDFIPDQLHIPIGTHHGKAPEVVVEVGQRVLRGETLAAAHVNSGIADVHASSSGRIREIETIKTLSPEGETPLACVIIDTDGLDCAVELPPSAAVNPSCAAADVRIEQIRKAGIVGLGGAAVSTSWKLTRKEASPILIINGAECEPYISCDDMLMRECAAEVLAGSLELSDILGSQCCIIAVERDKPQAINALREAATQIADARLRIAELPSIYPAGGERQLVELLIGAEVPSGTYPTDVGVICHNVGTARAVHRALMHNEPLISRVVTLTGGGIAEPRNVYARIGTLARDLITHYGGYADDPSALIVGGSMMGIAQCNDSVPVTKATNCILVLAEDSLAGTRQEWPCIRCGECASACPARLLPQELLKATVQHDSGTLKSLGLDDCIECGCCDLICPSHIALTKRFVDAKQDLAHTHNAKVFAEAAQSRFEKRSQRLAEQDEIEQQKQAALRAGIPAVLKRAKQRNQKSTEKS